LRAKKPLRLKMKIVADENIPFVKEAFSRLGEVKLLPGRKMTKADIAGARILLVRSVTRVNAELLEGTSVEFVATATIGTDHIDTDYLRRRGISFASAAGSNANSVAEYVIAGLLVLAKRKNFRLEEKSIGVVGVGNVGSLVVRKAEALGMNVLQNDPPLARKTGQKRFLPIEAIFEADIVTLHTPLTREGPDATYHMVDESFLRKMKQGSILINTSRGAVIEEKALKAALQNHLLQGCILDVWENEPEIDTELLEMTDIATPHIAGYSLDGKAAGTEMIYREVCRFLGTEANWKAESSLPPARLPLLRIEEGRHDEEDIIREAVLSVYDIEADDRALRRILRVKSDERGAFFDSLRKEYPVRREFYNTRIVLETESPGLARKLQALGFRLKD